MDPNSSSPRLLTTEEVAAYLHVSRATVYRMVDTRCIPVLRIGGVLRYSRDQVEAWLLRLRAGEGSAVL